jgi:hypothetical protein
MPAENPSPEMTPFEAALAAVGPAPARLDRDALMYAAGRRSVRRDWRWPALAGVLAVVSLALVTRMIVAGPRVVERIVVVHESAAEVSGDLQANSAKSIAPLEPADESGIGDLSSTNIVVNLVQSRVRPKRPDESHPQESIEAASNWVALPCPSLERDLGLPPGSLREIQPHESSSLLSR